MSCDATPDEVVQCDLCGCQFEPGVAGVAANGDPRCPQCGLVRAHPISPEEVGDFVVMRWGSGFG
jgi:hypothetical protein